MNIRLLETKANQVSFTVLRSEALPEATSVDFNLSYKAVYTEKKTQVFAITFNLHLSEPGKYTMELVYSAWFATSAPITDNFKESAWPAVNAPAIAFPYLRAYVTNFSVMNGMEPQMLPTINFTEMLNPAGKT